MANYLMTNVSGLTLQSPRAAGSELITVNPIHKTYIYNQTGTLAFQGYVPADFQVTLQSQWGPIFPTMSVTEAVAGSGAGADIERFAAIAGASSKMKALSAQLWEGPAYLQLSLPIHIVAMRDTKKEVIDRLVQISNFVAPGLGDSGVLVPPGPVPAAEMFNSLAGASIPIAEEQIIICQVGKFFRMTPCVVTSVVAAFSGQPEDGSGNPMAVDINVELTSYYAVTRDDLQSWFKGGFGAPGG